MRADRLIAVLMILQRRGSTTAAEVARELEISTRTARRDLEALAMSGVPLYSKAGRGGGWRLVGGATTDLTGLSSDEARALFLALGHHDQSNAALDAALRKLLVALPERFRDDAAAATTAIRVDPTGWGQIGPAERPMFVDVLSDAVITGRQAQMRYTTPGKAPSDRVIHPLGLVTKRGVWYVVANTDAGIRTFRLSRIDSVSVLDQAVDRPDDFDLDQTWESIVTHVEQRRAELRVTALVDPGAWTPFRYVFANRCELIAELDDGRCEVEVAEVSPRSLAAQLAGFGRQVEVIDPPPAVALEMQRLARELSDQWLERK